MGIKSKLSVVLLISVFAFAANTSKPLATMTMYMGEVLVQKSGQPDWTPVAKGMVFYEKDRVKTLEDGKAELFFYTGSKVRIANETEIEFTDMAQQKAKSIFLHFGKVWNKIRKGDQFEVESIHGVASVKGTEFDVTLEDEGMDVWVAEGIVLVKNDHGSVLSEKNTHTKINKEKTPSKNKTTKAEMPKWKKKFKAEALLVVKSPGKKVEGQPFKVFINLKDAETGKPLKGIVNLKIQALSSGLGFSKTESASDWKNVVRLEVMGGKAEFFANASAGNHSINITGPDLTGVTLPFSVESIIRERKVQIKFIDLENKENTVEILYKLK